MTDREMDALVAEKVMGWTKYDAPDFVGWEPPDGQYLDDYDDLPPQFLNDAGADYEVLRQVREAWTQEDRHLFWVELDTMWQKRNKPVNRYILPNEALIYEPGDYSRAALAALGANVSEISNKS